MHLYKHPRTPGPRRGRGTTVACAVAAAALLGVPGPAYAATGSGSGGTGEFNFTRAGGTALPPCTLISGTYVGVFPAATYTDGTRTYVGPVQLEFEFDDIYASPAGTFSNSNCTIPGAANIISADSFSLGPDAVAPDTGVDCSWTTGTYQRVGTAWTADLPSGGQNTCTLQESALGDDDSPTTQVVTGEILPLLCTPSTGPPDKCPSSGDSFEATNV